MRLGLYRPSKSMVLTLLLAGSVAHLLAPQELLAPSRQMTQLIALPQWATHQTAQKIVEPIAELAGHKLTEQEQQTLQARSTALENENAALRQQLDRLQSTVDELALLRQHDFPGRGVLLPAPVVGLDAAPRRDSLLLGKGTLQGVRHEDWVASRLFVEAGESDGVQPESAVLARETLIGWVEQTGTLTSRVVLLSDPYGPRALRVHLMHYEPDRQRYLQVVAGGKPAPFALYGLGGGKMIVRDIHRDFIERPDPVVAVGDLVTSDPNDPKLPLGMVVGTIAELRRHNDNPLLYDAIVAHRHDPRSLSQVYIVDLSRAAAADRQGR